ncbi:hexosaminidase D-like [Macrosteles quadrilineatus]|uniref:hexosaminidase D-like n=1 Tax=Macrosteles quadrilineatus TaxID=74068 RepID=UPI0023E0C7A4|nr:hexosaminidase D-like [Macrosteles quadrilineatus]XP_054284335.1 hexosaminidase D-like [Macrosteles quadrilineatus]XP_054284336.1 hexosaminidase D-like [Macrosteles quadrilineatus]
MASSESRLIHLDLKGSPLKIDYLEKLFPVLREWGATGLLIEWEDTFPYLGRLEVLQSPSACYTLAEIGRIHSLAAANNLTVVPLIQTFGHFEFVLKHRQFAELREIPQYPASLCPRHPESLPLVSEMLNQVMDASEGVTLFHIGADEVWHMGACSRCASHDKHRLFLTHLTNVLQHVRQRHPHLQLLMWDDMMRQMDPDLLLEFKIGELVEIVVWHYQAAHTFSLNEDMWAKYSLVFGRVWFASAYKGATGSCQMLPVVSQHISNHQKWLATAAQVEGRFQICGIVLTGWSRYDHYATLCELLPPSLPSLALCLRTWMSRKYDDSLLSVVSKELGYSEKIQLNPYPKPQVIAQELSYPGWKLAVGVEWLANLRAKQSFITDSDQVNTWLNPWQIDNNFTNPMQISSLYNSFNELLQEWSSLERYLQEHLTEVYYNKTIEEWVGTLVTPLTRRLQQLKESAKDQLVKAGCLSVS